MTSYTKSYIYLLHNSESCPTQSEMHCGKQTMLRHALGALLIKNSIDGNTQRLIYNYEILENTSAEGI